MISAIPPPQIPPMRRCPLCGHRFRQGADHCAGCPVSKGCAPNCCPRCGYEIMDRSATVEAVRRLARRFRSMLRRDAAEEETTR